MSARPLVRRQRPQHRAGKDRVTEAQLARVLQQPRTHQRGGGRRRIGDLWSRELRGQLERRAITQHRRRAHERRRLWAEPRERRRHSLDHGRGRDRPDALGGRGRERHVVGHQRAKQLSQQERVTAGGRMAGARERVVHRADDELAQQPPHTVRSERLWFEPCVAHV